MWFSGDDDDGDDDSGTPTWNLGQFALAIFCSLSVAMFTKMPINHYFGSGWSLVMYVLFIFIFAPPLLYVQLRMGCQYKRGMLGLFDKFLPLSLGFGIGVYIRNLISVIYVSGLMTHCLSYIFFSQYHCDNQYCVGGGFMWGSCQEKWREGDCKENIKLILNGPTAEESFYFNYVLERTPTITYDDYFPRWFERTGLVVVPHIFTWIIIAATVLGGAKVFGWILYFVIPSAFILFLSVLVTVHVHYANDAYQQGPFLKLFYQNFTSQVPVSTTSWDQFHYEPLLWGLLGTFVHLSMALNIWTGVYPIMGKWIGNGKKRRHLSWIIVIVVFGLIAQLPTLLAVGSYASAYSVTYLRCFVAYDWAAPFTIMPHVFSKFSSQKPLPFVYYVALFLFLLMSQALLFITTIEGIVDHLRRWYRSVERNPRKSYVIGATIALIALFPLSFPTIVKSGFYWIKLTDHYIDRLMVLIILGQAVGYFVALARSKRVESQLVKLFCMILVGIIMLITVGIFIWYAVDTSSVPIDRDCLNAKKDPTIEPIPTGYRVVGWLIALAPFILGLPIGLLVSCCQSRGGANTDCCRYMIHGDAAVSRAHDYAESHAASEQKSTTQRIKHPADMFTMDTRISRSSLV